MTQYSGRDDLDRLNGRRQPSDGLVPALERMTDAFSDLIKKHFELFQYEVKAEIAQATRQLAILGACLAVGLLGYVLLLVGLIVLAEWLGGDPAMALTTLGLALIHLVVGGAVGFKVSQRMREEGFGLDKTSDEVRRSKEWMKQISQEPNKQLPQASSSEQKATTS